MHFFVHMLLIALAFGWTLYSHKYSSHGPYYMDIYLEGAPNHISSDDTLNLMHNARRAWNYIPRNDMQIKIRHVYDRGVPCTQNIHNSIYQDDEDFIFGVICFLPNDKNRVASTEFYVSPHSTELYPVFSGASIFIDPRNHFNKETIYNIMLHEFGHLNLLKHPTNYVYISDSDDEKPVMSMNMDYFINSRRYDMHDEYLEIAIDDIAGVMDRDLVW